MWRKNSETMKKRQCCETVPGLIRRILLSWLLATVLEYVLMPGGLGNLTGMDGVSRMHPERVLLITCGLFVLLEVFSRIRNTAALERWTIVGVFGLLTVLLAFAGAQFALIGLCLGILVILAVYARLGWNASQSSAPAVIPAGKGAVSAAAGAAGLFFLLVCGWTLGRLYTFTVWSYDFGIFAQMFHSMKTTGLPMTTLERDGLLSHFAVHVSPVYYLMLPFYMLVPHPATLQVLQAAVMASAAIPLWKLAGIRGLKGWQRVLLCALLLCYPAYAAGASQDLHENCFLMPLLLWVFYGFERKNTVLTAVAAFLTLTVKEDAAVYVAVAGLYLVVTAVVRGPKEKKWELLTGFGLLVASVGWFLGVTGYLATSGDGVMTNRYVNLMPDGDGSLLSVIITVVTCPAKALWECVQGEKLTFAGMTMLPLLGLPLLTRRYERYLLLIPYVLVNFLSYYSYQHDIFFQYTFGSTAFLFYMAVMNLPELRWEKLRTPVLLAAVAVSLLCFGKHVLPTAIRYPIQAVTQYDRHETVRRTLDAIPEGVSVAASTRYTVYLSRRDVLYDVRYCTREHLLEAEYIALDLTSQGDYRSYCAVGPEDGLEMLLRLLERNGYQVLVTTQETMILHRTQ